jgi:hypothetical protein
VGLLGLVTNILKHVCILLTVMIYKLKPAIEAKDPLIPLQEYSSDKIKTSSAATQHIAPQ